MFYDTGSSSMDQIQSNDQPVWDMLPRRCSAMTFWQGYGGTLTKTSVPTGAIRRCEIQGRNDTGENWRTDTEMIPKHDNLIGG